MNSNCGQCYMPPGKCTCRPMTDEDFLPAPRTHNDRMVKAAAKASSPSVEPAPFEQFKHPLQPNGKPWPRVKASHVGAPAVFALELACRDICGAFDGYGCYLVGSALDRPDWRDVDVRFIMEDCKFAALFPKAGQHWEQDTRWLLITVSISERLSKVTGLPIDFQIQPQTHANERHKGNRHAIGIMIANEEDKP